MQEHGRIVCVMNPRQGVSQRSGQSWYSRDYVLLIDGRYERRVAFSIWGAEQNQRANLQLGEYVTIHAEVEAHEYEGNWYNEVRCYDVEKNGQSVIRGAVLNQPAQTAQPTNFGAQTAVPGVPPTAQTNHPTNYGAQTAVPGVPPTNYPPQPGYPAQPPY